MRTRALNVAGLARESNTDWGGQICAIARSSSYLVIVFRSWLASNCLYALRFTGEYDHLREFASTS
jgi:hypothetical protein